MVWISRKPCKPTRVLTIGDGLVTVVPGPHDLGLRGLIVTRASSGERLGKDFTTQIFGAEEPLMLAGGVLLALAAFPGLPKLPFILIGSAVSGYAWNSKQRRKIDTAPAQAAGTGQSAAKESLEDLLHVEPFSLEVGLGLVKLVEGGQNSPLLRRVAGIRRQLASELGYMLPPLRLTENLSLEAHRYAVLIKGIRISSFELPAGCELAISVGKQLAPLDGHPTKEPAFGIPAVWIGRTAAEEAKRNGYTVIDPVTVMGTHLSELVRRYAHELFSRQDVKKLIDRVAVDQPKLIEELVPKIVSPGLLQRIVKNLLREQVSVRDAASIIEALGEAAVTTRNPVILTEFVRQAIRREVVRPYLNQEGNLPAFFLDPSIERIVESNIEHGEQNSHSSASPEVIRDILARLERSIHKPEGPVVILVSQAVRYFLRQMVEAVSPNIIFISHNEVPAEVNIQNLGQVR